MLNEMLQRRSHGILVQLLDAICRGDDIDTLSTNGTSERIVSTPEIFSCESELCDNWLLFFGDFLPSIL